MNTALITTTINVPTVLELYRQHGPDVMFFVAGDRKTPDNEVVALLERLGPHCYMGIDRQHAMFKSSRAFPENCIQRRNYALLAAVQWGADIIVSIDDDNIPIADATHRATNYFTNFKSALGKLHRFDGQKISEHTFNGIKVSSPNGWFDVGTLLDPVAPHRGFPVSKDPNLWRADHVTNARVGIAAGICLGDPDISAVTRISRRPIAHRVSELLQSGIVVDTSTWTVFNSQNTAFIRELAPAFFMLPHVGRYDDIYASLIMQRVMRERGLHVHFGKPFVWQQRNVHSLVKDLRGEVDGMDNILVVAEDLEDVGFLADANILDCCREIWRRFDRSKILPPQTVETALAFLDDMEASL